MPQITYVWPDGSRRTIPVAAGDTVMVTAVSHGVDGIVAECGGNMMCATCHVYVDASCVDALEPMSETEAEALTGTASERKENSRLSCQIAMPDGLDDLIVHLPPEQL
jgi:2Fe-2S ferredoxin